MIEPRSTKRAIGEGLLWTAAGVLIAAAHAGAVAVLLREPEMVLADSGPPPAIMIELAPEAEAVITDETEISNEQVDAEEVKTATSEPVPEPVQEPVEQPLPEPPPPEPEPEVAEALPEPPPLIEPEPLPEPIPEIDPIEQLVMAELENVEVPIPMMRPPVPKPVVEKKKEPAPKKVVKKEQVQPPASQSARTAKAEVAPSTRNAAAATASGAGRNASPAKWQSRLMSHLERRKRYPSESRSNREEGTVYVRFRIDDSGNVLAVSLSRSSGYPTLDNAVLDMVRAASPVPPPPPGVNKTITAPVKFNIR
ncbi:TonB family protein [Rhizobium sp. CRIBSB]|uniref:Protein TonB n=1 Tax=Peteryoungia aggregata LMG 23059 TaxID=1368425 RepID=A0ABU0GDJ3_9HYPH|nr:energy transducer TonB [Peteryoungia aggregata]MDQ0423424.1 protein TonB [Peteryoungia aggregata LMG 23059]NBB49366.1 TonB family protein [Rhizobium sp. CRIBSB]